MGAFFRSKTTWIALLVLTVGVTLLALTRFERARVTLAEGVLSDALAPLQGFTAGVVRGAQQIVDTVGSLASLQQENQVLRRQVAQYTNLQSQLAELQAENEVLRKQLGLVRSSTYQFVPARVIGRSPDNWFQSVVIDRGARHGLAKDMVVMTEQGVAGRISKVTDRTATVMLILDHASGVGALIQSTDRRDAGVINGKNNEELRMQFFSRDAAVTPGDRVVTSGLGGIFPKGLLIGEVKEVSGSDYGLLKTATVKPAVDFHHLEQVLVIIGGSDSADRLP